MPRKAFNVAIRYGSHYKLPLIITDAKVQMGKKQGQHILNFDFLKLAGRDYTNLAVDLGPGTLS